MQRPNACDTRYRHSGGTSLTGVRAQASRCRGFTLLEVLAALAVFALASSLLLVADGAVLKQVSRVQDKIKAAWVADYTLNTYYTAGTMPAAGTYSRTISYGNASWFVRSRIAATSQARLDRVVVSVFAGEARPESGEVPVLRLTGYIRRPGS